MRTRKKRRKGLGKMMVITKGMVMVRMVMMMMMMMMMMMQTMTTKITAVMIM